MGVNQEVLTKLKALGLVPKAESYPASVSCLWASWTIGRTMPGWEPSHDSDPSLSRYSPHSCQHFWGHFLFSLLENMNDCWIIMPWLCTSCLMWNSHSNHRCLGWCHSLERSHPVSEARCISGRPAWRGTHRLACPQPEAQGLDLPFEVS